MWREWGMKLLGWGGKAAAAASPFKLYIYIALGSLVIGIVGTHLWNDHKRSVELSDLQKQYGSLEGDNEQLTHSMAQNELALNECLDANAWNALQAKEQSLQTERALANVRMLEAMNARDAEDIYREEATLRNRDQECRTADEPLPDWLLPDSLWDN